MAGIPGLDRAAMEKERLARIARGTKRERSVTPPPLARGTKFARKGMNETQASQKNAVLTGHGKVTGAVDLESETSQPVQASANTSSAAPEPSTISKKSSVATGHGNMTEVIDLDSVVSTQVLSSASLISPASANLKYPHGVIKKTWAFGHSRTDSDIKIEEVLEKATLRTAILSAFQWDTDWVFSKLDMRTTKLIFIMQAKEQALRDQMLAETADLRGSLKLLFPPMDGQINCMHSKLMLLFHPHKLRIVVPSANLTSYDWGETGIMENSVFLIDLPRLPASAKQEALTPFAEELLYFLERQGLDDDARKGIHKFDFGTTRDVAFVHSVGGVAYGSEMRRTGFMGLDKAVKAQNLTSQSSLQLDFCASSIGSLNDELLNHLHTAARGTADTLHSSFSAPKSGTKKSQGRSAVRDHFRIYFPTLETVKNSTGGVANGGTICFQRKWWEDNNLFPRECFRDYKSVRKGLLSHNKIIFARGKRNAVGQEGGGDRGIGESRETDETEDVAWAYVGSANMSESAWGKPVWDRSRKEWKLNCRNWECGVLVKVPASRLGGRYSCGLGDGNGRIEDHGEEDEGTGTEEKREVGMEVFDGIVDVPFEYPARDFGDREPWYFMESGR